jgi:putative resolvase
MRLSDWAREQGVHYQTAWRWAREGKMPVPVVKTATGRYLVMTPELSTQGRVVGYCRVSSADQKADVERQVGRVAAGALERGLRLGAVVSEIGSGLNAHRTKFPASSRTRP